MSGCFFLYLLGSLANRTWDYVNLVWPWAVVCIPLSLLMARPLNLLQLGDEVAEGLGLRVVRWRLIIMAVGATMVASTVAVCRTYRLHCAGVPPYGPAVAGNYGCARGVAGVHADGIRLAGWRRPAG